jgi:hypothetical protein
MQPEQDETAFEWIRLGRRERAAPRNSYLVSAEWPGLFVSHLIPSEFEAYARILHRVDAYYENIDNPLSASEIAILKIPSCEPLKSFVTLRRAAGQGTRVRWKELSALLSVPFVPEVSGAWYRKKLEEGCWPRFLRPGRVWPIGAECMELASTLDPFAEARNCFFKFSDIPFIGKNCPPLFRGSVDEVNGFLKTATYGCGFEHWWPADHTWCVCSDFDLDVTVVGGSRELISGLLASSVLECIEVKSGTRVDPFAPTPK